MRELIVDVETTGLNPLEHELVAIGFKSKKHGTACMVRKNRVGYEGDKEYQLLRAFWLVAEEHDYLVGFNLDFDWTFLKLRSLKHGIRIKHFEKYTQRKDIRLILNSNPYAKGTTLKDYAQFFGFTIDDDIDGSKVPELYAKGDYEAIEKHLLSDITLTSQLWERLKECEVVEA